jgi:uncharacterized membrane protein (Fun14 family)
MGAAKRGAQVAGIAAGFIAALIMGMTAGAIALLIGIRAGFHSIIVFNYFSWFLLWVVISVGIWRRSLSFATLGFIAGWVCLGWVLEKREFIAALLAGPLILGALWKSMIGIREMNKREL